MKKIIIAGGGLAGLVAANLLARAGVATLLVERKKYPFHRVCGEYISNETLPFLKAHGLFPKEFEPVKIKKFQLTSVNGRAAELPLDMGGFGISRYAFDHFLFQKAKSIGVEFLLETEIEQIQFLNEEFKIQTRDAELRCDVVVGAFGKRSKLDVSMDRKFIHQRSPYVGVKYHVRTQHPADLIALHNFQDGYCGISNVEEGKSCLCYLSHRDNLKKFGSVIEMERNVLFRNPFLRSIFLNSEFLFDKPETINEISFERKNPVEQHVLMCGDAASMIAPLCGNGMAMAIHAAKIVSDIIIEFSTGKISRAEMEKNYDNRWHREFARRLWAGRKIQNLFGAESASNFAVNLARYAKPVAQFLVSRTHGTPF